MIYTKAKKPHWSDEDDNNYLTRKDRYHKSHSEMWAWYNKKPYRKIANRLVRRYKGELSDGGSYKRVFDVQWSVW